MAQLKFGSAGVTANEIDISGPTVQEPVGVPAGVIGTANRGRAFVPVTVGTSDDFYQKFGKSDGKKFGPLAVSEWLRNAGAATYVRVLGVGDGTKRLTDTNYAGSVTSAGFVVGENLPDHSNDGQLTGNSYANSGSNSVPGRTYMLGAFMSESAGSWVFSDAGLQGVGGVTPGVSTAVPILRGVLMAASGVIPRLSSSYDGDNSAPASTLVATDTLASGSVLGSVVLLENSVAKQDFVMLLNGHQGSDPLYPNVITASFDMTSPNYFANVLNTDPLKLNKAGHYLYAHWDIHPTTAVVTGAGLVAAASGSSASTAPKAGAEAAAFILTSSLARNTGDDYVPNYENFEDRFSYAKSPWFVSQKFGGSRTNLFRVHALDAGQDVSNTYKLSIENIATSNDTAYQYGTFDLVVRKFDDRDGDVQYLEEFRGLSLDPSSDRYIAKIIGDADIYYDFDRNEASQKLVVDGQYTNNSNYIRVEVSTDVADSYVDATALPFGYRGIAHMVTSGSMPMQEASGSQLENNNLTHRLVQPPLPMRKDITAGSGAKKTVNPQLYWGAQFQHVTSLSTPNASTLLNKSMYGFAKYFPDFMTAVQPVVVSNNQGAADTDQNGILDADRFNRNIFALDHIQVVTNSSGIADPSLWESASYIRSGDITTNDSNKTRAVTTSDFTQANRNFLKYTVPMQGGFDGVNIFDKYETDITNEAVAEDMNATNRGRNEGPNVKAYMKAVDIMKNTSDVDIQLLAIPGIRHPIVTNYAVDAVENRFDSMYIMDIEQYDTDNVLVTTDAQLPSVQNTATDFENRALDSSFAAAYWPDVVLKDPNTNTNLFVPPSVVVLGALALNDAVGHPWFAPAGTTRGALSTTQEARVKLSKSNMDTLYDIDINPLVAFPGNASSGTNPKGGVVVWGQKTLQAAASALDRVNVRRLMIELRRQVREVARTIIFEPNRDATLARFSEQVTPKLQRIQALSGLERFKVIIDSSTTTQADVENNTIRGKIFVQPYKSIEFVSLDFVVTNNINQTL